jgi:DNA polymerase II small subunit
MEKKIISFFQDQGMFIQPAVIEYLMEKKNPLKNAQQIMESLPKDALIISMDIVEKTRQETEKKKVVDKDNDPADMPHEDITTKNPLAQETCHPRREKILSADYDAEIEIIRDITGRSLCEGKIENFAELFLHRYRNLSHLLKRRQGVRNAIPLNRIKKDGREISLIGIVDDARETTTGHMLIELEDEYDTVTVLLPKGEMNNVATVVKDEIIGITGKTSRNSDLIMAESIIRPDISLGHKKNHAQSDISVAFLSDIHMGSKTFLNREWNRFIEWMKGKTGNEKQRSLARSIKYLVVPGDAVEGIGIYPHQEEDLEILDLFDQYAALAEHFQLLPDHIELIVQPGNHDAVRQSLPQPALDKDIQKLFSDNTHFIGNPCYFKLSNVEILSYHGQSLIDFVTHIPSLRQNKPVEIMKEMLQRRHLAPIYGGNTHIAPEKEDYLLIQRTPDIFVTGHVHVMEVGEYRGVTLINASTWQSQTDYQKMRNIEPHPAKLPIVNLRTGHVTALDFQIPFT